ncbi:MAG: DUF2156 domain-containing protein [Deltaproteobacteria bacterium]|nr:DUF2156 domain-containing protein [Deltaproteobacteria bacterium]
MKIPDYPQSRPLAMTDRPVLERIFNNLQPQVSELTFAGLYLFRQAHEYRITRVGNATVILGKGYDGASYFLPPLDGDIKYALSILFGYKLPLYGADEGFVREYLVLDGRAVTEERDSFDYLYLREDLATLPGNRFHRKKNRISYFTSRHDYQVSIFTDQDRPGCLDLLKTWGKAAVYETGSSLELELGATAEAIALAGELGLQGVVIRVDGSVAAFALGERLNRETAVCHFEKSNPFMEGLTQLINREFANLLFTDCRFVNREQDLGKAGLRQAKLSYHPLELLKKYRATPS